MTAKEYKEFEASVEKFLTINKVLPGCHSPKSDTLDSEPSEPYFSWQPCECCGSNLGGNREAYSFGTDYPGIAGTFDANICVNCVYYLAYGKLDDLTMLEISESI